MWSYTKSPMEHHKLKLIQWIVNNTTTKTSFNRKEWAFMQTPILEIMADETA